MSPSASTPEELEMLFEDACVLRDRHALAGLFADGAVLDAGDGRREARGADAIARSATAICERDLAYVAAPRRVVQARELALVVADTSINVARRGDDGMWLYAISVLCIPSTQRGRAS